MYKHFSTHLVAHGCDVSPRETIINQRNWHTQKKGKNQRKNNFD